MQVGDVFQLQYDHRQGSGGIMQQNFYYRVVGGTSDLTTMLNLFSVFLLPLINATHRIENVTERIALQNLFDPDDFEEFFPPASVGTLVTTGDALPNFTALRTRWFNDRRSIRTGTRRFYLGSEQFLDGNLWDADFIVNTVQPLTDFLSTDVTDVFTEPDCIFRPCAVKRIKYVKPGETAFSYRLPENQGELSYANITGVQPLQVAGTQVSRRGKA